MNEGKVAAKEIIESGMPVTLYVDAAMKEAIEASDIILVGADTFTDIVIVNKIGTTALALLAKEENIPVYCLTTTAKFLPAEIDLPSETNHPIYEVWPGAPENIHIKNKYFEDIPIDLITDIVTEVGFFKTLDKQQRMNWLKIDPWLRDQF